jgi:hypothetical protein
MVQATLVSTPGSEIHEFIQTTDSAALLDKDEDGEHAPLLLSTLDLSHWTSIMLVSTQENGVEKAMARLQEAHAVLPNLLEKDEINLDRPTPTKAGDSPSVMHPILGRLNIPHAQQAAIEDYGECIQSTQLDQELASLDSSSKGPAIPFLPQRTVEVRLNMQNHRSWCLNNINLLTPNPTSVWKIWRNLSETEVKACEDRALNSPSQVAEAHPIANAFPLALFDHHKCTTTSISLHAK